MSWSSGSKALVGVVVAVVLGAGALTGCAPTEDQAEVKPSQSSAPKPTPTKTQAPDRYEGYDFTQTDPLPAELEPLQNMTPEEFIQAPKADQLKWASWFEQYRNEFAAKFKAITGLETDAPYTLTADSDLITMLKDLEYTYRIIANTGSGNPTSMDDNGPLDKKNALKLIIAHRNGDSFQDAQREYDGFLSNNNGLAINAVFLASLGYYDYAKDSEVAEDFTSRTITFSTDSGQIIGYQFGYTDPEDGVRRSSDIVTVPYTDYKGNQAYSVLHR